MPRRGLGVSVRPLQVYRARAFRILSCILSSRKTVHAPYYTPCSVIGQKFPRAGRRSDAKASGKHHPLPTSDREANTEELEGFATNRRARPCPPAPIDRSSCSLIYRPWARVRPSPRALLRTCGMGAPTLAPKLSRASASSN